MCNCRGPGPLLRTQTLMSVPFGHPRSCNQWRGPRLWVAAGLGAASSEPCGEEGEPLPPELVPMVLLGPRSLSTSPLPAGEEGRWRRQPCTQSFVGLFSTVAPVSQEESSAAAAAAAKLLQSCSTLCNPIDGSPPGSSVPGILQARTLEWVAISLSNA